MTPSLGPGLCCSCHSVFPCTSYLPGMQWGSLNKFVGTNHFTLLALQLNTWGYFGPTLDSLSSSGHFHLPSHPRSHSGFLLPVSHPSPCTCLTASGPSTPAHPHTPPPSLNFTQFISKCLQKSHLSTSPLPCPREGSYLQLMLLPWPLIDLPPTPFSTPFFQGYLKLKFHSAIFLF